jgi:magnesium transporter
MAHEHPSDIHPAPETAGHHLVRRVPTASPQDTVGSALGALGRHGFDAVDAVYLVDHDRRLVGLVPLAALCGAPADKRLRELAHMPATFVLPETDQEHVASRAIAHGLSAMPVVDRAHRLLGVVPAQALLEVLRHEHVEDLHRLAGIRRETVRARTAIEAPPLRRVRDRLPWLLAGLAGSAVATLMMAQFEAALAQQVAIAFFVPALVYLADAIGTQTEAIVVRGLSLSHASLGHLLGGELRTGLLIGAILGGLAFLPTWLLFGDVHLAAAVAATLVGAAAVATTIGLVFPWVLARVGRDPAYGSGPLATIIQDVLTLVIYFGAVQLFIVSRAV